MSTRYTGGIITNDPQPLNPAAGNAANGVFTMNQYAQAVQNGTWPAYDPYFDQTTLLLHGNGTNGAQNNTFLDSSTNNFTITRNGNTTQGSFSPFSKPDGAWGNYFDGNGDYLRGGVATLPSTSTSTFTIEAWVYPTSDNRLIIGDMDPTGGTVYLYFGFNSSEQLVLFWFDGATKSCTSTDTLTLNAWNYVAAKVSSNAIELYVNSSTASALSGTTTLTNRSGSVNFTIGQYNNSGFSGYISNIRVSTVARTIAIPTAPFTSDGDTRLLTCQSNRFVDNSTNNFTITRNGDVRVTPFSPFPTQSAYSPTVNGGSGYFDGSGDTLSLAHNSALSIAGNVSSCVEAWVYPTGTGTIANKSGIAGTSYPNWSISINSSGYAAAFWGDSGSPGTIRANIAGSVDIRNRWSHIVATKTYVGGGAVNDYRLFVNGVLVAYTTNNNCADSRAGPLYIGSEGGSAGYITGYISNLRLSNTSIPAAYQTSNTTVGTQIFTPPTSPVDAISGTTLLTNFTNAGVIDSTMSNNLETVGNAQIDTAVKKFGDGSLEFDGTGDYLVMDGPAENFAFGTGDFTIEMWLYANSVADAVFYDGRPASTNGAYPMLYFASGILRYYANTADRITSGTAVLSTSTWYHIALCRSGTSTKLFLNGVQIGSTYTDSTNYLNTGNRPWIGVNASTTNTSYLNGYIDDLRITKGVARYTSNFAVPYLPTQPLPLNGGSYAPYTTLMLPGTGTNGAQNNTFIDSSTNNFTITRNGNTTQGTFSPFSRENGYWGNYFDGSGDYLNVASNAAFGFDTGDFTIEFWMYPVSVASGYLFDGRASGALQSVLGYFSASGSFTFSGGILSTGITATGITANRWYHIACVRNGGTAYLFVDGVSAGTDTISGSANASNPFRVGSRWDSTLIYTGYVSNFRVNKGTALYTSNFTPSTSPLTAVSGTSFLTCQSNRFVDNSTNALTITTGGDPKVTTFSPFEAITPYSPTVNGGSGYFDGSGDYLSVGSASDWTFLSNTTAAYTIEMWIYPTTSVETVYFDTAAGTTANVGVVIYKNSSNAFVVESCFGSSGNRIVFGTSTGAVTLNAWNHVFISYDQSLANTNLVFYINGVAAGTANKTANTPSSSNPQNALSIATYGAGSGSFVTGYMGSLRISNTVRSVPSGVPTAPYTSDANTVLLTNFTNAGIYDASMSNDLETVGNAQISTSVSKFGGGSMYFDGTGDYLTVYDNAGAMTQFGTGAFTIEFWVYANSWSQYNTLIDGRDVTNAFGLLYWNDTSQLRFISNNSYIIDGGSLSTGTWHHIAIARSGTSTKMFINGTQSGSTASDSYSYGAQNKMAIGANIGSGNNLNGYISNLRILKGVALLPTALQTSQWQDQ